MTTNLDAVLDTYAQRITKLRRGLARGVRGRFESACTEGCSWCCCLWVPILMPDALLIARHLLRTGPDVSVVHGAFMQQHEHATRYNARLLYLQPNTEHEHVLCNTWMLRKIPCVFLVDNRCSVYPVRPISCWTHLAKSPEAPICCELDLEGKTDAVPCYNAEAVVRGAVNLALRIDRSLFGRPGLPEPMAVAVSAALKIYGEHHDHEKI